MEKPSEEIINGVILTERVTKLRNKILTERSLLFVWQDALFEWDKSFKLKLEEKFGSRRFAQQVPAWQKLVGGTPEPEVDITDIQRKFILNEVQSFVNDFTAENNI